jgi:hypothetical protein
MDSGAIGSLLMRIKIAQRTRVTAPHSWRESTRMFQAKQPWDLNANPKQEPQLAASFWV